MLWTVSSLEHAHKVATDKVVSLQNAPNGNDPEKEKKDLEDALKAVTVAQTRVNIAKCQIPIVSIGLDNTAFKCLETRPRLAQKLNDLLTVSIDPLDKLEGPLQKELLESRVCISGEGDESSEEE
jgi:hypothetical protein